MKKLKLNLKLSKESNVNQNVECNEKLIPEFGFNSWMNCASMSSLLNVIRGTEETHIANTTRGLTGLRNLGNTCYMNAALQSLSNSSQLTLHVLALGKFYKSEKKKILAHSYYQLIYDMWNEACYASVTPSNVLTSIKMINPSFRGHQQQDAQEFLRCLMDRLHEETKFLILSCDECVSIQDGGDADLVMNSETKPASFKMKQHFEDSFSSEFNFSDDSLLSCKTRSTPFTSISKFSKRNESQLNLVEEKFPKEFDQLHSCGTSLYRSNSFPSLTINNESNAEHVEISHSIHKHTVSPQFSMYDSQDTKCGAAKTIQESKLKYCSVISDIFDGALWSSVQCKTCNSIWHTKETFQDLSLPIPGKDDAARLHGLSSQFVQSVTNSTGGPCTSSEGYRHSFYQIWDYLKSWFFGPQVTLSDCLSAFFSNDELKGDNMYNCEKCNKLRNGVKYCRLFKLPEVLCIHLKRFRYEYHLSYSTKISSTVTFPLLNLDLSHYVSNNCVSQVKTYDLSSVIVHHGGAGGGHYTSYCHNPLNGKWYEFDDQYVTEVAESVVIGSEAYVLFYSKVNEDLSLFREEVLQMENSGQQSILMRFFISVEWIIKFLTCTEPGPINNHYFLCHHKNVKPFVIENVKSLVCCVSEKVWHALHQKYGGGPIVTRMQACELCLLEQKTLKKRRNDEQEMYLKLSQVHEDDFKLPTYYISMVWFRKWQSFIQGNCDPPGKIDNSAIAINVDGRIHLKKDSDYGEVTANAWKYLQIHYGGGPAIPRVRYHQITKKTSTRENSIDVKLTN